MAQIDPHEAVPRFAVIGNPIAHSWSPWIHAHCALHYQLNLDYGHILADTAGDDFRRKLDQFWAKDHACGLNITLPFKRQAFSYANNEQSPHTLLSTDLRSQPWLRSLLHESWYTAVNMKSANTMMRLSSRRIALDTDTFGLIEAMRTFGIIKHVTRNPRILILGAGATAYTVLSTICELPDLKDASVCIFNRTTARAQALVKDFQSKATRYGVALSVCTHEQMPSEEFTLIVNTTSAGHSGQSIDIGKVALAPQAYALDLNYGAATKPFKTLCQQLGCAPERFCDGVHMLVHQAHRAFLIWRHEHIKTALWDKSEVFLSDLIADLHAMLEANKTPATHCVVIDGALQNDTA